MNYYKLNEKQNAFGHDGGESIDRLDCDESR